MNRTLKPKGFSGKKGYNQGGQMSRTKKPADLKGKTSKKGYPGAK